MLLNFRTGSNKPIVQVEQKFSLYKLCVFTEAPQDSPTANWAKLVWENRVVVEHNTKKYSVLQTVCEYDDEVNERRFIMHSKLILKSITICTKDTCKGFKYDDSWIQINNSFYNVMNILSDCNSVYYFVVQKLNTREIYENLHTFKFTDEIKCIKYNNSLKQCIHMQIKIAGKIINYISPCKFRTQID